MHRQQQGIAFVVVLLSAMVLIVALLAVTSTLALSSRRATAEGRVTLQAQYAAESGLSRARSKFGEIEGVLQTLRLRAHTTDATVTAHAANFCAQSVRELPDTWTPEQRRQGVVLCDAAPVGAGGEERFSLFTAYTPRDAYPEGTTPNQYWREAFGGERNPVETRVASDEGSGTETWYRTAFGLIPEEVRLMGPGRYRFTFGVSPVTATGEVRAGGEVSATRTVRLETPGRFDVTIERSSFSAYSVFRNDTRAVGGAQLYFAGGERFGGPVHTNGRPGFARSGEQVPTFLDTFTTAAHGAAHAGVREADYPDVFQGAPGRFGADEVALPTSSNTQLRAAFGGVTTESGREREVRAAWNVPELKDGVYYSAGDGQNANRAARWQGGLYVKGDAKALTFSTRRGQQVIAVTQEEVEGRGETTVFTREGDTWRVEADGRTRTLSGDFSGVVYVDGDIDHLGGDGTNAPDIAAKSQITLVAAGDITIKESLTYTDSPFGEEDALNVLGIYTSGGDVLLDGPRNQDLGVHAAVMASRRGAGFGTRNPNRFRGYVAGEKARVNLLGSLIEDQSQTVGTLGSGGYARHYRYDPRFAEGFAPPFFPAQTTWTSRVDAFSRQRGLWEVERP